MAKPGRKRLGDESHTVSMKFPIDLLKKVDEYQKNENMPDRTSTIRKIIADHLGKCIS